MVAVVQWHTGDVFRACVDRLQTKCPVSAATRRFEFGMKFALKGENELCGFALLVRSLREFFICFVDESSALCASPRAHAHKPAIDHPERSEALECRIDPAIERNVGRTLVRRRRVSIATKDLAD